MVHKLELHHDGMGHIHAIEKQLPIACFTIRLSTTSLYVTYNANVVQLYRTLDVVKLSILDAV